MLECPIHVRHTKFCNIFQSGDHTYTDGDFWRREHHGMFLSRGLKMILREDYKSRDEVEGLIFFPKYHFKPQDTGNIP